MNHTQHLSLLPDTNSGYTNYTYIKINYYHNRIKQNYKSNENGERRINDWYSIIAVHCIRIIYFTIELNAALAENRREIEKLQEQISTTSVQLLVERQKSKGQDKLSSTESKEDEVIFFKIVCFIYILSILLPFSPPPPFSVYNVYIVISIS